MHLPKNVLLLIVDYLQYPDLLETSQVNRRLNEACKGDSLWKREFLRESFGTFDFFSGSRMVTNIPVSFPSEPTD